MRKKLDFELDVKKKAFQSKGNYLLPKLNKFDKSGGGVPREQICNDHMAITFSVNRQTRFTDTTEDITFPDVRLRYVNICLFQYL